MKRSERSLRSLVEKWFSPTPTTPVRITRFTRANANQVRYVEAKSGAVPSVEILFFRHDDGSWCVFPPGSRGPVLSVGSAN
jgi:hypothetical protein